VGGCDVAVGVGLMADSDSSVFIVELDESRERADFFAGGVGRPKEAVRFMLAALGSRADAGWIPRRLLHKVNKGPPEISALPARDKAVRLGKSR